MAKVETNNLKNIRTYAYEKRVDTETVRNWIKNKKVASVVIDKTTFVVDTNSKV